MFKVLKNLKESWISVITIVLLLIVQAAGDLTLPDYTSKIVNVGIQNGGIENVAPEVIRKSEMENMLIFTEEDDKVLASYEEISKDNLDSAEYEKLVKKYPALENESLYKIKKISNSEQDELDSLMAKPLMMLSVTKQMPKEQLDQMLETVNQKIDDMQESILEQAAIQEVKNEYKAIGMNTDSIQNQYIIMAGLKMLGISLIIMISAISIMCLSARVAARLAKTLREKVFKKVLRFSNKEFSEYSTASLITRSTNDIQQIQGLIAILFRVLVYAPIIGIGGFLRVLNQSDNSMAWIIGVAIVAILFVVATLFIIAMPRFKKLQQLIDKLNLVAREILTGLPVIRAFNTEKKEEKRFDKANMDLTKTNLFVNRAMSFMMPTLMLIMNGISLLIVWVGAHGIDNGTMQVGNMMAFIQYTMQIVMSFLMISMVSIMLPRASVSANRINEIIETEETIKDSKEPKKLNPNKKGLVEFKNVSFRYPGADEDVISNISFKALSGKTTAFIGSTGSGKSTLINLIPRFYDATKGEILIDGVNIKNVSQHDLREKIGFIPQKGLLFSGTIESNLKYGGDYITDEDIFKASEIAQAMEFISNKEEMFNAEIAQGGTNVSGGQKQRLAIARAIAKKPEIFIFDDSFSALDFKTDAKLRKAINTELKESTLLIVAQRISTIMNADQIIVLDEGKIVGKGTHKELMNNCEVYQQIALSQLSKEELENE